MNLWICLASGLLLATPLPAQNAPALSDVRIVIVRHAEKPDDGNGLTPAGEARAKAYVSYFEHLQVDGKPFPIDHIFAAKDGKNSMRPRLTMTPLSQDLKLPLDQKFKAKEYAELAQDLEANRYGKDIVICWHHGDIPALLTALGAKTDTLVPGGHWPDTVYDWAIELSYDHSGHLEASSQVHEHLMPGDAK